MATRSPDFRVSSGFRDHPKVVKLERLLGEPGVLAWLELLAYTSLQRPDGRLSSMDAEDIAIAARWKGEAAQFIDILLNLRLLDRRGKVLGLHNWPIHNGYAAGFNRRSEHARKAVNARWEKRLSDSADAIPENSLSSSPSNTRESQGDSLFHSPASSPPQPSPKEREKGRARDQEEKLELSGEPNRKTHRMAEIRRVFDAWNLTVKRLPKVKLLTPMRIDHVRARLRAHSLEELSSLFAVLDASDFAASGKWASFDWITQSEDNLAKVAEGNYDNRAAAPKKAHWAVGEFGPNVSCREIGFESSHLGEQREVLGPNGGPVRVFADGVGFWWVNREGAEASAASAAARAKNAAAAVTVRPPPMAGEELESFNRAVAAAVAADSRVSAVEAEAASAPHVPGEVR
jgi:hypothetical protein